MLAIQYSSVDEGDNYEGSWSESTYCRKASSCVEKFGSQILSASFMFYVHTCRWIFSKNNRCTTSLKKADLAAIQSYPLHRIRMRWQLTLYLCFKPELIMTVYETAQLTPYRWGQVTGWCYLQDATIQTRSSHRLMLPSRCDYTDKVKSPADVTFKMRLYRQGQVTRWCYLQDATIQEFLFIHPLVLMSMNGQNVMWKGL